MDDEPGIRRLLTRVLGAHGCTVCEAADGQEALDHLERVTSPFDLVVSDIAMPRLDGIALSETITRRWPTITVVLMSGYPPGSPRHAGRIPADVPFLLKPFTVDQLLLVLGCRVPVPGSGS